MTFTSMHPMFQVLIDFCDHSAPNSVGKSTYTYSYAYQANVAVNAESKLQSRNCRSYWNLEVFARVPRLESNYVYLHKLQPLILCHAIFGETFTVKGENFA